MTDYENQYNEASVPMPNELIGTWEVTVLSGHLPNMRKIGHVKVIKPKDGKLQGYNRTLRIFRWGYFSVGFSGDGAMFSYGDVRFYDMVKIVNRNLLIGQYVLVCNAREKIKGHFVGEVTGYFQMRRKD